MERVCLSTGLKIIGDCAFGGCTSLSDISIPDSVDEIGTFAFGFSGLKTFIIPDTVEYVGDDAFDRCNNLTELTIGKNVKNWTCAGWGCEDTLTTVHLTEGRTEIEPKAFSGCKNLKKINLPDSVTQIGDHAFYVCSSLSSITIPDSVDEIGTGAFGFSGLKTFIIPDTVEYVGDDAFDRCNNLTELTIGKNVKNWTCAGWGCEDTLTTVHLAEGRTEIEPKAFSECKNLKKINLPNSVTQIGDHAFFVCSSLSSITIPGNVTVIEDGTFWGCGSLKELTISMGVKKICSYAFYECNSLTSVFLPDSVEEIDEIAFYFCKNITEWTIGKNVDLENFSFGGPVTTIYLTEGRTEIPDHAFHNQFKLKSVTLPKSLKKIGNFAFTGCSSLESIDLPAGLKSIGDYAFQDCTSLSDISIPDSVDGIGEYAFSYCKNLKNINIPKNLTKIENRVFYECSGLTKVIIPSNIQDIGEWAYDNCTNLSKVVITGKNTTVQGMCFSDKSSIPNLKIYGLSGSAAEKTFAKDTRFVALESIDKDGHGYVADRVITPSTCSTQGKYVLKCVLCEDCGKTYTAKLPLSDNHEKIEKTTLVPASIGSAGKTAGSYCKACKKTVKKGVTIPAIKTIALAKTSYTYNGKVQKPSVTVKDSAGNKLTSASYSVQYASGCKNAGNYTVKVVFKGNYRGSKSLSYKIVPATQKITVKVPGKTYLAPAVKAKEQVFTIGASAKTALDYKSSNTKYVTVDKKGKVTVKKGTPGGTYQVTITAAQTGNYRKASTVIVIKVNLQTQSIKTNVTSKTYKAASVKAKNQAFTIKASAKTALSYKSSNTKYVTVNKKGAVTIKKGTPKGTYKIVITAVKNGQYKGASKIITIKVS